MKKMKKFLSVILSLCLFVSTGAPTFAAEVEYVPIEEYVEQMTELYSKYDFYYYYINTSGIKAIEANYLEKRLAEDEKNLQAIRASEEMISGESLSCSTSLREIELLSTAPYNKTFYSTGKINSPNHMGSADIKVTTNLTLNAQYEDIISVNSITSHQEGSYKNFKSYSHSSSSYTYSSVYELNVTVTGWAVFEWKSDNNTEGYAGYRSTTVTVKTK